MRGRLFLRVEMYEMEPGGACWRRDVELSDMIANDARRRLDMPNEAADAFSRMLCSTPETIQFVLAQRSMLAEMAARMAREVTMALLANNDTMMGYPKEEQK